jgi:hypothetical protein
MKQKVRGVGVGTVSLVLIFAVLCITVFSVLTLSTANTERIMANRTADFISSYYNADTQATIIKAHIIESHRNDTLLSDIETTLTSFGVRIIAEQLDDTIYVAFIYEINDALDLSVKLQLSEASEAVLEWRMVNSQDWEVDDSLSVWDGSY